MYRVPQAGPWWPAVGAPLERGVRHRFLPHAAKQGLVNLLVGHSSLCVATDGHSPVSGYIAVKMFHHIIVLHALPSSDA